MTLIQHSNVENKAAYLDGFNFSGRVVTSGLFFRLEDQEEIFFNQKQRASQRAVPANLGECKHFKQVFTM